MRRWDRVVRAVGVVSDVRVMSGGFFPRAGKLGNADVGAIAGVVKAVHSEDVLSFFKELNGSKLEPCDVNTFYESIQ